jgi:hypothetical protein
MPWARKIAAPTSPITAVIVSNNYQRPLRPCATENGGHFAQSKRFPGTTHNPDRLRILRNTCRIKTPQGGDVWNQVTVMRAMKGIAENDTALLGLGQRILRAFRDHGTLFLRGRRIDVQHEGVNVLAQRRDDEREALGDQPFQFHPARRCEEIRTDLATLEQIDQDALRPALQQPFEIGLAHRRRQLAQIIATFKEDVAGAQLDSLVVLAGMQRVEIGDAVSTEDDGLAVDHELLLASATTLQAFELLLTLC